MKVVLKKMTLTKFKGIESQTVNFNDACTIISGANGTGKTTLFDAFVWCLFGKDSSDRKQFNIKTLDKNGVAIPRVTHEVEVVLQADEQTITLRRCYTEKWQKKRSSIEEELTGHEESRYYNDIPLSVAEYSEKINALCKEEVFKMATNPHYFLSQKDETQRTMLFRMAGEVSNNEIAKDNTEFAVLLDKLQGKTIEEYKKEVSAKSKRIKDEIKAIPIRIEEVQYIQAIIEKETTNNTAKLLDERIEELKNQIQTFNKQLEKFEKEEFLIQSFTKAKATAITDKINALFANIRFKLFETQINGVEVECCKAMINGVPYSDANNASKINAGLDIINAICKYEGITTPIFIDNAESVNEVLPTKSQQIRLVVTTDKVLNIK